MFLTTITRIPFSYNNCVEDLVRMQMVNFGFYIASLLNIIIRAKKLKKERSRVTKKKNAFFCVFIFCPR